jgi:hypothetical protein
VIAKKGAVAKTTLCILLHEAIRQTGHGSLVFQGSAKSLTIGSAGVTASLASCATWAKIESPEKVDLEHVRDDPPRHDRRDGAGGDRDRHPLLSFAPKLYLWFLETYMAKIYRRLRDIDAQLQTELMASQVIALQADLENIDRSAHFLPMRHSDLFLSVEAHIDRTRSRLASRLVELRG